MSDQQPEFNGEVPADLVFDDDPIESVLYESTPAPATEADIFAPARRLLAEISSGPDQENARHLARCERFLDDGYPLTPELAAAVSEMASAPADSSDVAITRQRQALQEKLRESLWRREANMRIGRTIK